MSRLNYAAYYDNYIYIKLYNCIYIKLYSIFLVFIKKLYIATSFDKHIKHAKMTSL